MINSEQAFDMLPDMVNIFEKLDIENYRKESLAKYQGEENVDYKKVGLEVIFYIIKNSGKVKDEFFSVVSIAEGKEVEEIKKQSLAKTITTFKEILTDKELMGFFKTAMQ
ncbi:hypothetical protein [Neobacillus sp. FSL H8-0543]|uniref:hypothetical protein n=1 Tax=Neobacillus sp. FSL H8-0543 TaxID=2954672 RepID=UPI0031583C02